MKISVTAAAAPAKLTKETKLAIAPKQEAVKALTTELTAAAKELNQLALAVSKETDVKKRTAAIKKLTAKTKTLNSLGTRITKRTQMVSNVIDKAQGTKSAPVKPKKKPLMKTPGRINSPGGVTGKRPNDPVKPMTDKQFEVLVNGLNKKHKVEFIHASGPVRKAVLIGPTATLDFMNTIAKYFKAKKFAVTERNSSMTFTRGGSSITLSRPKTRSQKLDITLNK